MFWNTNSVIIKEIDSLLANENVTLSQLMAADDILQECKSQNKKLVEFLVRPDTIAELVSLITEEPPKDVEWRSRYRNASTACEIMTSDIPAMGDRISADSAMMNKLCDFINRPPPLNPLLASFFSKTVEMLLARRTEQDWYSYQIVCLRVIEFFKGRSDFLPNLMRHIGTSAIMDTIRHIIKVGCPELQSDITKWLDTNCLVEQLIQIICGTFGFEESSIVKLNNPETDTPNGNSFTNIDANEIKSSQTSEYEVVMNLERLAACQSANAAQLLCDMIQMGREIYGDSNSLKAQKGEPLLHKCTSDSTISLLLQSIFTAPSEYQEQAIVNGIQVLLTLLENENICWVQDDSSKKEEIENDKNRVAAAIAPHLPLVHHVLLQPPFKPNKYYQPRISGGMRVGQARLACAQLVCALCSAQCAEVPAALVALRTPHALLQLFLDAHTNNFLHAHVQRAFALALRPFQHRTAYANHLLLECNLLTRLMDVWDENECKKGTLNTRLGYMGHVILILENLSQVLRDSPELLAEVPIPSDIIERWNIFVDTKLQPVLQMHATPLGGCHPADKQYQYHDMSPVVASVPKYQSGEALGESTQEYRDRMHYNDTEFSDVGGSIDEEDDYSDKNDIKPSVENPFAEADDLPDTFIDIHNVSFDDMLPSTKKLESEWEDDVYKLMKQFNSEVTDTHNTIADNVSPWEDAANNASTSDQGWANFDAALYANIIQKFQTQLPNTDDSFAAPPTSGENVGHLNTEPREVLHNIEISKDNILIPVEVPRNQYPMAVDRSIECKDTVEEQFDRSQANCQPEQGEHIIMSFEPLPSEHITSHTDEELRGGYQKKQTNQLETVRDTFEILTLPASKRKNSLENAASVIQDDTGCLQIDNTETGPKANNLQEESVADKSEISIQSTSVTSVQVSVSGKSLENITNPDLIDTDETRPVQSELNMPSILQNSPDENER